MKKFLLFLPLLLLFSCEKEDNYIPPIIEGTLPMIIIVGQSNAEGFAPKETAPDWLKSNNYSMPNYLMWNRDIEAFDYYSVGRNTGSNKNNDTRFGFDIFFAKNYLDSHEGTLLAIKQSLGDVPISEKGSPNRARWNPDITKIPSGERAMVSELSEKLTKAKEYAKSQNAKLVPIAILYHQGEADGNEQVRLNDYKENLISLIAYLRQLVDKENIPIINAEVMYRNDGYKKVNSIFFEVNQLDPYFKTINMGEHQTSIGDNLHYDASAFSFMGTEIFYLLQ